MLEASPMLLVRGRGLNTYLCALQTCRNMLLCTLRPSEGSRDETLGEPGMGVSGSFGCREVIQHLPGTFTTSSHPCLQG